MSKQGIQGIAKGRSDVYQLDPHDLNIKADWNCRDLDTPEAQQGLHELAASIAEVGVKQALTVYWEDGKAYITDGHRRYQAVMMAIAEGAEIKSIPVRTEDRYSSEADRIFSQIVRNSGEPLKPFEQARVFKRLIDLGWTETDIAKKSGKSRPWVVSLLELQAAPESITQFVRSGAVSATMAIQTIKDNAGDQVKSAAAISAAVEKAHTAGKQRATSKDMTERKASFKDRVVAALSVAGVYPYERSVMLEFTYPEFAVLEDIVGGFRPSAFIDPRDATIDALDAENARFRIALEVIVQMADMMIAMPGGILWNYMQVPTEQEAAKFDAIKRTALDLSQYARAALYGGDNENGR